MKGLAALATRCNDPKFLEEIRKLRCLACGNHPNSNAHHIWTRGSGGSDQWWNVIPLCVGCHTGRKDAWHRGKLTFLEKFPHVWEHLEALGWERNGDKLFHKGMLDGNKSGVR